MSENNSDGQFVTDGTKSPVDEVKGNENSPTENAQDASNDTVKYSTHQKAINQLKSKAEMLKTQQQELEELRNYKHQMEEAELARKGEYEKLLSTRDERIQSLQSRLDEYERNRVESKKLGAFIDKLGGELSRDEYYSFVDFGAIQMNPETEEIDAISLEKEVETFRQKYHDLIKPKRKPGLPNVAHVGGQVNTRKSLKSLSNEELKQLYIKHGIKEGV